MRAALPSLRTPHAHAHMRRELCGCQRNVLRCYRCRDVDTEDGMEFGATILGPSHNRERSQLRVRFADDVEVGAPVYRIVLLHYFNVL